MSLAKYCVPENLAWQGLVGKAYHYTKKTLSGDSEKTVFRYQIPFPADVEAVYLARYGLSDADRLGFYQNLVRCIQREVDVTRFLKSHSVSSILSFSEVEQLRDDNGIIHIFLETERIYPILRQQLGGKEVSALTVIDILYRLSIIFRDINRVGVVHRGFDLEEVYITSDNKILLGGFFYASCPGVIPYTEYLPHLPPYLPKNLRSGGTGSQNSDIQSLSVLAWNLFSGGAYDLSLNTAYLVRPEYAPQEIIETILLGLRCKDEECNSFRRQLLNARKSLSKTEYADQMLPLSRQALCSFATNSV